MYSGQIDNVHPVNRGKIRTMIPFEDLFGQIDHFLHRNVEAVAYPFEESVHDMKVDD